MKIKSLILIAILSLITSLSFAKSNGINTSTKNILAEKSSKLDSKIDDELENFDFQKVFDETEKYFRAAHSWKKLKCTPNTGFICTKWKCDPRDTKIFLIIDKDKKTLSRCDGEECEIFEANFEQSGVFYSVQTSGQVSTLVRILGDSRYKEITAIGLDAYIANGNCEIAE